MSTVMLAAFLGLVFLFGCGVGFGIGYRKGADLAMVDLMAMMELDEAAQPGWAVLKKSYAWQGRNVKSHGRGRNSPGSFGYGA
jgi:hypothetical protein